MLINKTGYVKIKSFLYVRSFYKFENLTADIARSVLDFIVKPRLSRRRMSLYPRPQLSDCLNHFLSPIHITYLPFRETLHA